MQTGNMVKSCLGLWQTLPELAHGIEELAFLGHRRAHFLTTRQLGRCAQYCPIKQRGGDPCHFQSQGAKCHFVVLESLSSL